MPSMTTLATSGHSADGLPRRAAVSAIQAMVPWRPCAYELGQPPGGLGHGVGRGHADDVEACPGGGFFDQRPQAAWVGAGFSGAGHQKSRSA